MKYDTIFFDIGNTLFFYNYEFLSGLLLERFDADVHPIKLEEMHKFAQRELVTDGPLAKGHSEIWLWTYRRWMEHVGFDAAEAESIIEAIKNHPFSHLFWTRMEEGVPEMLDWFRERGFRLGVISNAEGQIGRLLRHVGVDSKFDAIIDSGEVGMDKPDEGIFKHALALVGADPSKSIHVGDLYEVDVVGARNAGITPILVERVYNAGSHDCLTVERACDLPKLEIFQGL